MDGCWPQALARAFDTLVLDDVPQLSAKRHNEAARFVTLVDELYEARCRVVCWSAVPLAKLFDGGTEVKVTADGAAATPFNIRQSNEGREAERAARDELLGVEPAAAEAPTAGAAAGAGAEPVVAVDPAAEALAVSAQEFSSIHELRQAFGRAESRLVEMGGAEYSARKPV